jgi:His-Xaa-Ser system radical SAM maturase HxsB
MELLPFRFRDFDDRTLLTSEGGDFGFFDTSIVQRLLDRNLTSDETEELLRKRVIAPRSDDWRVKSLAVQSSKHSPEKPRSIRYLILVPTLRCNLDCSYCQVSRAPLDAKGFDWESQHLELLDDFFSRHVDEKVKIEFQGGEISLRPDLIEAVQAIAERHCTEVEYVACTNLFEITPDFERLIRQPNFYVSTSLDGDAEVMQANRTGDFDAAQSNIANIKYVIEEYGLDKISFLPTFTAENMGRVNDTIDLYFSLGANGIFLRPVNFMGFARKTHADVASRFESWTGFYEEALEHILELNRERYFEETYLADLVRRVFLGSEWALIDFRSPSRFLSDFALIDFDGAFYPSDEARMLTRTRHVDLSVGSLDKGFDEEKIEQLNSVALNQTHPDCIHCAYLPYCGVDTIDDVSRYGRVDLPKSDTWFCNKQTFLFDWIFEKVASRNTDWLNVFAKWVYRSNNPPGNLDLFLD